jgi:hypothetical protein
MEASENRSWRHLQHNPKIVDSEIKQIGLPKCAKPDLFEMQPLPVGKYQQPIHVHKASPKRPKQWKKKSAIYGPKSLT